MLDWIFILEGTFRYRNFLSARPNKLGAAGIATAVIGAGSYFFLHNYPETASFLSQDERDWAVWRKATDGTSAGEHTGMSWKLICKGLFNWQVWLSVLYVGLLPSLATIAGVTELLRLMTSATVYQHRHTFVLDCEPPCLLVLESANPLYSKSLFLPTSQLNALLNRPLLIACCDSHQCIWTVH